MPLIMGNNISTVVPGLTNSSPTGAITKIPKRNLSKSTITIIATIIKMIVQSVPSIFQKVISIMVYIDALTIQIF
jgi:hypothetical protein